MSATTDAPAEKAPAPPKDDPSARQGLPQWKIGGHSWLWLPGLAALAVVGLLLAQHGSPASHQNAASVSVTTTPSGQIVKVVTVTVGQHTKPGGGHVDEAAIGASSPTVHHRRHVRPRAAAATPRTAAAPAPRTASVATTTDSTSTTSTTESGTSTNVLSSLTAANGPLGKKNLSFYKKQVGTGFGQIFHFLGVDKLRSDKIPPWVFALAAIFAVLFLISAIRFIRNAAFAVGAMALIGFLVFGGGTVAHFL